MTVNKVTLDAFKDALKFKEPAFVAFVQEDLIVLKPDLKMLAVRTHEILDIFTKFEDIFGNELAQVIPKK